MYDYLDKVLKALVKEIYQVFQEYRALPFDELNVVSQTNELYKKLGGLNITAFRKLAKHYYNSEEHGESELPEDWLLLLLAKPSAVIKYAYTPETYRKRDRLAESLTATNGLVTEYDKAMKYWVLMAGWFALDVADAALKQARVNDGVVFVKWQSEHDNKVCGECSELDGKIFFLNAVPDKPHPNCRCRIVRVEDKDIENNAITANN